jgi:putative inorganic carbon (HCO3(-)) transporter
VSLTGLLDRTAAKLSLAQLDQSWSESLRSSILLKPVFAIFDSVQRMMPQDLGRIGSILQKMAFGLSVLLFGLIGLPQFASDKFALAIVIITGLGLWVFGRLLGGSERREFSAYDAIVLAYLAANVIATFASHYFTPSLKGLGKVIVYIGSYFLFSAVFAQNMKRKLMVLVMVLACGVALSLYGFYQYKIGVAPLATWEDPTVEGGGGTRIFATLGNPNLLAGLLVPLAPLALGLGLGFLFDSKNKPLLKVGALIAVGSSGILALASILTQSRGGFLGLAAGFVVILYIGCLWVWVNHKKLRMLVVGGAIVLVLSAAAAVVLIPSMNQRVSSMFAGREHSSNSYRMNVYSSSLKMFKDNWWIGTGPGNETFRLAYGLYMVSSYDALGTYCVPLEVAVETGIPGVLAFFAMIACAAAKAHVKFWGKEEGGEESPSMTSRWVAAGLAAALIGLMIHGMVDTVFYRPQVHFLFWLIIALLVTSDQPKSTTGAEISIKTT